MKKAGWIGLGNMGTPMAKNLEKALFPLSVYNRSADKTAPFENGTTAICQSISRLVESADIIFTMVSNDSAVQAVYDEILSAPVEDKLFIDMSTISQQLSMTIAQKVKAAKASFLDAPVLGSTQPAAQGTLIIVAGGEASDLETAMPFFEKIGKLTKHMGENGKGIATKLAINYYLAITYQGIAETVLFAGQQGIQPADIMEVLNESAVGSGASKIKTPSLVKDEYPPAFALNLMLKDILLAKDSGVNLPMTQVLVDTYQQAKAAGFGEQDVMAIIKYLK